MDWLQWIVTIAALCGVGLVLGAIVGWAIYLGALLVMYIRGE